MNGSGEVVNGAYSERWRQRNGPLTSGGLSGGEDSAVNHQPGYRKAGTRWTRATADCMVGSGEHSAVNHHRVPRSSETAWQVLDGHALRRRPL